MALRRKKRHRRAQDIAEKAAELAPPEEQRTAQMTAERVQSANTNGAVITDTENLNLPQASSNAKHDEEKWYYISPVVIVILTLALAFIAFIAYLISLEPPS